MQLEICEIYLKELALFYCLNQAWTCLSQAFIFLVQMTGQERCRHDKDLVLAAVSGDGRCLALSALQDDVDFAREARTGETSSVLVTSSTARSP